MKSRSGRYHQTLKKTKLESCSMRAVFMDTSWCPLLTSVTKSSTERSTSHWTIYLFFPSCVNITKWKRKWNNASWPRSHTLWQWLPLSVYILCLEIASSSFLMTSCAICKRASMIDSGAVYGVSRSNRCKTLWLYNHLEQSQILCSLSSASHLDPVEICKTEPWLASKRSKQQKSPCYLFSNPLTFHNTPTPHLTPYSLGLCTRVKRCWD